MNISELLGRLADQVEPGSPPTGRMVAAAEARRRSRRRIGVLAAAATVVAAVGVGAAVNGWPGDLTSGGGDDNAADSEAASDELLEGADDAAGRTGQDGEAMEDAVAPVVGVDQVGLRLPGDWVIRTEPCGPAPGDVVEAGRSGGCPGPTASGREAEQVTFVGAVTSPGAAEDAPDDADEADGCAGSCRASAYFADEEVLVTVTAATPRRAERLLGRVGIVTSDLVAVPPFAGRSSTADSYADTLRARGLRVRVGRGPDLAEGPVRRTSPAPGVFVPAGSTVRVWASGPG